MRLTQEEMALIIRDRYQRVPQREMMKYIGNLG